MLVLQQPIGGDLPTDAACFRFLMSKGSEGGKLEAEIKAIAKGHMRIIGPNCLGVLHPPSNLNASFAANMARPGRIALLSQSGAIEFVALRIARVVGPGIKKSSSPWRAQMFEAASPAQCISIPFAPDAELSLAHVEDVARMLISLAEAPTFRHSVYNSPAEIWTAHQVKELIERVQTWPEEVQEEAIETLLAIEQGHFEHTTVRRYRRKLAAAMSA